MKQTIIISFLSCILTINASAKSFNDILYSVAANNPTLAAGVAESNAELSSLKSENNLPDPEIGYEHTWGKEGTKWGVAVTQSFEWPGLYSTRNKAIKSTSKAMEYLNRSNFLDKLIEIKLLLIDIVNTRQNISLMEQIKAHIDELEEKYNEGYKRGEVTILDINKIKVEQIAVNRQYNSLKNQLTVLEASLLDENGGKDCSSILSSLSDFPDETIHPVDYYIEQIEKLDPLVNHLSLLSEAQTEQVKAAKLSKLPGFSIGYKMNNELGASFNGFSIGISIPVFSQKHKKAVADAVFDAYKLKTEAINVNRVASMRAQYDNAVSLYKEIEMYRPIFDNNNMALLRKALDGGEMSLLNYLQEVNYFLEARMNYQDVQYRYHQALTSLNRYSLLPQ